MFVTRDKAVFDALDTPLGRALEAPLELATAWWEAPPPLLVAVALVALLVMWWPQRRPVTPEASGRPAGDRVD